MPKTHLPILMPDSPLVSEIAFQHAHCLFSQVHVTSLLLNAFPFLSSTPRITRL